MTPSIRFDFRFIVLAALLAASALLMPAPLRSVAIAVGALGIAMLVLAPMPPGTRGLTFAVMIGIATGISSINLFAVSIFQLPVTREFGWAQAQYSLVLTMATVVTVLTAPAVGRVFDRHGVRRFAIACTGLLGLALISLYWLTPSLWHFYLLFALMPLLGAGTSSIAYSRVVARWFFARRGQAFGAALAGVGIGGAVLSVLSQFMIGRLGWRGAYVGLGLLLICGTMPVLLLWLRDTPEEVGLAADGEPLGAVGAGRRPAAAAGRSTPAEPPSGAIGYTARETRRLPRFWLMLLAFFLLAFAIGGVMLQLVPILRERGIAAEQAAGIQGLLGLALIVGRAFAGFLMDRLFAPYVAAVIILFPTAGTALLASGAVGPAASFAAMSIGLAAGAELDVIAYLITRYFGTRGYAETYGWQYAAWTLGSGTAPVVTARSFDHFGTHTPILWTYVGVFALSAVMIARLGPYPRLAPQLASDPEPVPG